MAKEPKNGSREVPLKLGRQYRSMQIEGYDPEKRTVTLAASSDAPVERWYGTEVLDHSPGAIRSDRLKSGMALLFNHDPDKHLGVTQDWNLGSDGKLRTTNRLGDNPLAKEKEGDVASGILKDTSIGYLVHKYQITEDDKGNRTYTAVDWEPLENSLVTVPADVSVGVGRGAADEVPVECVFVSRSAERTDDQEGDGDQDDDPEEDDPDTGSEEDRNQPIRGERTMASAAVVPDVNKQNQERIAGLRQLRQQYPTHFSETELLDAISNGTEIRDLKEKIADKVIAAASRGNVRTAGDTVMDDMSKRERAQYSMLRVLRHAINTRMPGTFSPEMATLGIEKDVDQELRKRLTEVGATGFGAGVLMPSNLNVNVDRAARAADMLGHRATLELVKRTQQMEAGSSSYGAATLETITESTVIELLRNRARVIQLGGRLLGGLQGIIKIPRQNAASQATWLPEYTAVTASALGFDSITLSPNRLGIQAVYTMELLAQTAVAIEDLVRADQAVVQALAIDYAWINGSGTGNVPLGLLNRTGLALITAGATTVGGTGAGNLPLTYFDILEFENTIAEANADVAGMGWMFTPRVRRDLRGTLKFPGAAVAQGAPIWPDGPFDQNGISEGPLGYKAGVTMQLPQNLGSDTNQHAALFGDFSSAIIADWGVQEVVLDNITQAAQGAYVVTQNSLHDCNVRHLQKFVACVDILP